MRGGFSWPSARPAAGLSLCTARPGVRGANDSSSRETGRFSLGKWTKTANVATSPASFIQSRWLSNYGEPTTCKTIPQPWGTQDKSHAHQRLYGGPGTRAVNVESGVRCSWARSAVEQALCVGERGGRRGRRPVGVSAARLSRRVTGRPLNGRSGEHLPLSSSSPSQGFHLVTSLFFITRRQAPNAQKARSKSESSLNRETRFLLFTRGPLGPGTV